MHKSGLRIWNFHALLRSMLGFGLVSSAFDLVTFLILIIAFKADAATFQTAWLLESLLTELATVAVMRTARPFFLSRPSLVLALISSAVALGSIALPMFRSCEPIGVRNLAAAAAHCHRRDCARPCHSVGSA